MITMTKPILTVQSCYNIIDCVPYGKPPNPVTEFITGILYLLISFSYSVHPPIPSLLATTSFFSLSINVSVLCLFSFLDSTCKSDHGLPRWC